MATITGSIRIITQTRPWLCVFALFGAALALLSYVDLRAAATPFANLNERIVDELARAETLPGDERLKLLTELRLQQERALAGKPAEPFAWARLAYLRLATQGDAPDAFAALRMSDLVSPGEPRQLPERALMWRQLHAAEDQDQQAYQTVLWQNSFRVGRDATWQLAAQHGITAEVAEALRDDPELYEEWKARVAGAH